MQYSNKDYNEDLHDRFKALTVKQPYANNLIDFSHKEGEFNYAYKSIEVRRRPTKYRGDLLICSSASPVIYGLESGVTLGLVELYDIIPISEFTKEDWENTLIPQDKRQYFKNGFGWLMRNPRRVIEYPVKGQLGIYNLVYTKFDIMEYPSIVKLDKKAFNQINKKDETVNNINF
jgi:hypothetical protein